MSQEDNLVVSIVVEERPPVTRWGETQWVPVEALPLRLDHKVWTPLGQGPRGMLFFAGATVVELHKGDTAQYRETLAAEQAFLWVVLRPTGAEPPVLLHRVTADATEAEVYVEAPGSIVETVAMPEEIRDAVALFVARHHVEHAFLKRKRDRAGGGRP